MYNGATGYFSLMFMELRSTAGDKIERAVTSLRSDPRFKSIKNMVEILLCDPAGEWHSRNTAFMDVMRKLKIHFIMRATNADKRQMAEGEGAVKIVELQARRIKHDRHCISDAVKPLERSCDSVRTSSSS